MPPKRIPEKQIIINIKSIYSCEIILILNIYLIKDICKIVDCYLEIEKNVKYYNKNKFYIDDFDIDLTIINQYSICVFAWNYKNICIYELNKNKYKKTYPICMNENIINFILKLYKKEPLANLSCNYNNQSYEVISKQIFCDEICIDNGLIIKSYGNIDQIIHIKNPVIFVEILCVFKKVLNIIDITV